MWCFQVINQECAHPPKRGRVLRGWGSQSGEGADTSARPCRGRAWLDLVCSCTHVFTRSTRHGETLAARFTVLAREAMPSSCLATKARPRTGIGCRVNNVLQMTPLRIKPRVVPIGIACAIGQDSLGVHHTPQCGTSIAARKHRITMTTNHVPDSARFSTCSACMRSRRVSGRMHPWAHPSFGQWWQSMVTPSQE